MVGWTRDAVMGGGRLVWTGLDWTRLVWVCLVGAYIDDDDWGGRGGWVAGTVDGRGDTVHGADHYESATLAGILLYCVVGQSLLGHGT